MRDAIRVAVETDDEERTVRVHDDEGEVEAGDATFRFSVSPSGSTDRERAAEQATDDSGAAGAEAPRRIAPVGDVPVEGTLRCEALDGRRGAEFILRREDDTVYAWRNSCPHKPEVRLDPGDGAIVTDDHVVCHEHGARFERGDGTCTRGPCRGAALDELDVAVRDGDVYLTDDRFEAARRLSEGR